jgi:hypothetical protein
MAYAPRTIGFQCDLLHPPVPVEPSALQRLHARWFEAQRRYYSNFNIAAEGVILSNPLPAGGAVSHLAFLHDRIQFREDLTGLGQDDFTERVAGLLPACIEARGIQLFLAQQISIRTLINLRHHADSRVFLRQAMFRFREELEAFGRQPQLLGLRLAFAGDEKDPSMHVLRIESYHSDPRSLFIEDQATFPPAALVHAPTAVRTAVASAYRFTTERAVRFVANFDARQKA